MAPRAKTPRVTINGPSYLTRVILALKESNVEFSNLRSGGQVPLTFSKSWSVNNIPRDSDVFFGVFPASLNRLCEILTESTTHDHDSFRGTTIYEDSASLVLYRLQWRCPPYRQDDCDASGEFEVVWGLERETAQAILEPLKQHWLTDIAKQVLLPAGQLLDDRSLFEHALQNALQPFLTKK